MILRNKTGSIHTFGGEKVRPFRTVEVDDEVNYDPNIWVKETGEKPQEEVKEKKVIPEKNTLVKEEENKGD